jgi:nicotinamide-nucleotide amidase
MVEKEVKSITSEILIIGNELLNGTTLDTNSHWLSKELTKLGVSVVRKSTVGDNIEDIKSAFQEAIRRNPNWIFSLGGLGPTYDDKTLLGLAYATRRKIKMDPLAVRFLKESAFELLSTKKPSHTSPRLLKSSLKMAKIPEGSIPLKNPAGSAPGVLLSYNGVSIVALPGVPREMKAIFKKHLKPLLSRASSRYVRRECWLDVEGVGESKLARGIEQIAAKYAPEIYVKSHPIGFKKGKSLLKIQLIQSFPKEMEARERRMKDKLLAATREMIRTIKSLGGRVKREKLV